MKNKYFEIGLSIVVVIAAFFILKKLLDALDVLDSKPKKPKDLTGDTGSSSAGDFQPEPFTNAIYSDVNEVWGVRDIEAYNNLAARSNDELILIYADWLDRYFDDEQQTLTQAIEGESVSVFDWDFGAIKDIIVERLHALNLN